MKLINKYNREIFVISEFKDAILEYHTLGKKDQLSKEEIKKKQSLREKLNTLNGEVASYVRKVGVSASIYYSPPPAVGGLAGNVDFFANLFNLRQFSITTQMVIDSLERAIGNYKFMQRKFRKKLINPIYWIGEAIRIPFYLASFAGFNGSKIEFSIFGKLYKFISGLLAFIWILVQFLNFFGFNVVKMFEK